MAEWLRRQTRNLVGSARVGSNPADVVSSIFFRCLFFRATGPSPMHKTPKRRVQVAKGHASCSYYAGVSSDRTNLSPFTKDYRGLALSCDFDVFVAREGAINPRKKIK